MTTIDTRPGRVLFTRDEPARTADELQRYAMASGDMNPLHLERDFARQAGFDDLVVHGMLNMARMGSALTAWLPEGCRLTAFGVRFEGVLTVGVPTRFSARVREADAREVVLDLELGTADGRAIATGSARIALPDAR